MTPKQAVKVEKRGGSRKTTKPLCGADTDHGPCELRAGWGTDHVGKGKCRKHLGATRNHRRKAAREESLDFVRGAMGAEVAADPLDALLQGVRIASGAVAYWRLRLHPYQEDEAPADLITGLDGAIDRLTRTSKAAVDAGVAEKLVQITERMAERITLAAEEALAAIEADAKQRKLFAETFASRLASMEDAPVPVGRAALTAGGEPDAQ